MPGKPSVFKAVLRVRVSHKLHNRFLRLAASRGTFMSEILREVFTDAADRLEAIDAQRTGKAK